MSALFHSITDTIGNTPLVKINHLTADLSAEIYLKCEFFNPLASVKDRIGRAMIEAAERDGQLNKDSIVIEPTSGNTGIALAFVCAAKGYRLILTMPETMSVERRVLLKMLGAEIVPHPGPKGMPGAIARAGELVEEHGAKAFMPQQFETPPIQKCTAKPPPKKFGRRLKATSTLSSLAWEPEAPSPVCPK